MFTRLSLTTVEVISIPFIVTTIEFIAYPSFADIDDINDSFSLMEAELFVTVQLVRLFVIEKTNGCITKYIVFGSLEGNKSNCP